MLREKGRVDLGKEGIFEYIILSWKFIIRSAHMRDATMTGNCETREAERNIEAAGEGG